MQQLLAWFDGEEHARNMPWRKPWIDPNARSAKRARHAEDDGPSMHARLKVRAYQVWISEIMLQQTRVETVRDYWNRWMERWPTIEALASATRDDVLSAWRGLGYYSRATRIHQAAQSVVHHPTLQGMLPAHVEDLQKMVPGVGRYTAGAISSIVFGHAVPILDGNIARVLSRQTGLYADPKSKATVDLLWDMARLLVEQAAAHANGDGQVPEHSATPGQWNQALMELGSTLCTAQRPECNACPIQRTCMVYAEGNLPADAAQHNDIPDMEDVCTFCAPFPEQTAIAAPQPKAPPKKKMKQTTLFGAAPPSQPEQQASHAAQQTLEYVRQFPLKVAKQASPIEPRLVCIVRASPPPDGPPGEDRFWVEQRPDKGLLAGLWEFPMQLLLDGAQTNLLDTARGYIQHRLPPPWPSTETPIGVVASNAHAQGTVRHVFSHLVWDLQVVLLDASTAFDPSIEVHHNVERHGAWLTAAEVESATMGTGMRRCWSLITTDGACHT
ncbi:hypothetical protein MVES1_001751 [Malassezia vespertilionis]|uniref:uncharacterized protein n=1 Tax=Malassezia vespertilionis TaxID=2020962 RepID=UPI0024B0824D|nr:uncharacterized protein MVES1_001751 [Malassezia vespertilionis]WFD06406.1 hypothetical protein MVES1_001751 [Malassezia vespertilionis]